MWPLILAIRTEPVGAARADAGFEIRLRGLLDRFARPPHPRLPYLTQLATSFSIDSGAR